VAVTVVEVTAVAIAHMEDQMDTADQTDTLEEVAVTLTDMTKVPVDMAVVGTAVVLAVEDSVVAVTE